MSEGKKISLPYLVNKIAKGITNRTFPQPETWFGLPEDEYEEK
jgi:hypothetical protein